MNQYDPNNPFRPERNVVSDSPLNPNQSHKVRTALIILGVLFAGLVGCTAIVGGVLDNATVPSGVTAPSTEPAVEPSTIPTEDTADPTPAPHPSKAKPSMTASQEQAVGAARDYLEFTAFSRKALIHQLSSSAGAGFSVKDATFAVDYLKVDWNDQAAKAARQYLEFTHFSRAGLIHQLESPAGAGFTHKQAVYGASKAGL